MEENTVLKYIPQRPPFVMIDCVEYADEKITRTKLTITEDNILADNGLFTEAGLIENIAQTAAARAGVTALTKNEPVVIGYIGAVQNLKIFALPAVNDTIHTTITVENEILNVLLISGTTKCNENLVAQCNMKIFIDKKLIPQHETHI